MIRLGLAAITACLLMGGVAQAQSNDPRCFPDGYGHASADCPNLPKIETTFDFGADVEPTRGGMGWMITSVVHGGVAARAGLVPGDTIVDVMAKDIHLNILTRSRADFDRALAAASTTADKFQMAILSAPPHRGMRSVTTDSPNSDVIRQHDADQAKQC